MNTKLYNLLFCGVGGQGVLKAAEICGISALRSGFHVKKSEVHGMSQRGGSVESHLRFGKNVYSPLIPRGKADFLVCFNLHEGKRLHDFLHPRGVTFAPFLKIAEGYVEDRRFLNTFLLGVLSRFLPIKQEIWLGSLEAVFTRAVNENKEIFLRGTETGIP